MRSHCIAVGQFSYDEDVVQIPATANIVLERLRVRADDREYFRLHRTITYQWVDAKKGTTHTLVSPPGPRFETDLASVPQLLTWLVPKSGRHLPAALVHDAAVRNPDVDRFEADRVFRDGMGDLDVGLVRRWIMWTAVSLKTIQKRGTTGLRIGAIATGIVVLVLGVLATINLVVDATLVPWMGDHGFWSELAFGLAGAVVIPIVLGVLLWAPIRAAGVIAGVAAAVLLHVMVLVTATYFVYLAIERAPRWLQTTLAITAGAASLGLFAWGLTTGR